MSPRAVAGFLLALAASAAAGPVRAQERLAGGAYVDGALASARTRSTAGTLTPSLHGPVFALSAGVSRWSLVLEGRYAQGGLTADDPAVPEQDLTEGEIQFGVRLLPALTVTAGPHARTYSSASGTQRWVFWEARVAGNVPLIPSRLDAHAQLWGAVVGSTSLSTAFGSERGGEVGARLSFPRFPVGLRIAYRIDHGSGINPARSDTMEQILLAVRLTTR
jgi:hypothetical protein